MKSAIADEIFPCGKVVDKISYPYNLTTPKKRNRHGAKAHTLSVIASERAAISKNLDLIKAPLQRGLST